jgi:hypothetical protein
MQSGRPVKKRILRKGAMLWAALAGVCLLLTPAAASGKDKDSPDQMVDSGSFGVFITGRRIATETFSIRQTGSGSSVNSEFKSEAGTDKAAQTSDLELNGGGELKKYEWKEISPGQSQAVVVPNESFLTERFTNNPQEKQHEQPFLMPASTSILDDYFFIQREVLAWKFLATSCKQEKGELKCPLKQRTQFGTLNPHARASMPVSVEFAGKEKVTIRGAERELNRLDLKSDTGDWTLWLDDQFKLQRISIPVDNTEVVRD